MGAIHEQETNVRMIPMDSVPTASQRDPPPYAYSPLTPESETSPSPPLIAGKTILVPPPSDISTSFPIPGTPATEVLAAENPIRILDSRDPLSTCDSRFADLVLTHIILPRLRVGVLRWKDRESLEFVPRTKEDKKQGIRRSKYDEELGFLASEYKFRFHAVEQIVTDELEKAGFKVKKLKLKEKKHKCITVKWRLKQDKGKNCKGQRTHSGGCCGL